MSDIYHYKSNKWNIHITRTLKSTMDEIKKELVVEEISKTNYLQHH